MKKINLIVVFIVLLASSVSGIPPECSTGFCLFDKPLFDYVLPDTLPEQQDIISDIEISASPAEFEPATFIVYSDTGLFNVTVEKSDLSDGTNTIPAENVDIRVVKVWEQAGYDTAIEFNEGSGVMVPELLLYDDSENLRTCNPNCSIPYDAPSISTVLRTDVPAGTSKQFWITVEVPEDAEPGTYTSTLKLKQDTAILLFFLANH
jgi:hypothetical protein